MAAAVSKLNGVELTGHDSASGTMNLTITQQLPRGMPAPAPPAGAAPVGLLPLQLLPLAISGNGPEPRAAAAGAVVVEHVLSLEFEPGVGCALLRGATLSPAEVDIGPAVAAAQEAQQTGSVGRLDALAGLLQASGRPACLIGHFCHAPMS